MLPPETLERLKEADNLYYNLRITSPEIRLVNSSKSADRQIEALGRILAQLIFLDSEDRQIYQVSPVELINRGISSNPEQRRKLPR